MCTDPFNAIELANFGNFASRDSLQKNDITNLKTAQKKINSIWNLEIYYNTRALTKLTAIIFGYKLHVFNNALYYRDCA